MDKNSDTEQTEEEQVLSKRERNELRREEKINTRDQETKKRRNKKNTIWILVILIIVSAIYGIIILIKNVDKTIPGESVPILGSNHIQTGAEHEEYNSNPPTSGSHYAQAPGWGIYSEELEDEQAIHSLEHGGIWISYKNLDEPSIEKLENIAKKFSKRVILSPREENDVSISVASWGRLMKLDEIDVDLIEDYIRKNTNKSPERLAQ